MKLGPKSQEVLFMGYPPGVKGYQVCDVATSQFFNSHDVVFDENMSLLSLAGEAPTSAPPDVAEDDEDDNGVPVPSPGITDDAPHPSAAPVNAPSSLDSSLDPSTPEAPPPAGPLHCSAWPQVLTEVG